MEGDEEWCVDCSDDEKYSYSGAEKGVWEPLAKDIKELYEKLAAGEELKIDWSWPRGRRSPSPEPREEKMDEDTTPKEVQKEEKQVPTAFDFDDFGEAPPVSLTPRRTPGSKTPRSSQKRVARMDKIMNDFLKEKKSTSPGQKTMVPGHRPLPGLGGANRLTPKPGLFGSAAAQRSPASTVNPGGPRPALNPRTPQSSVSAQVPRKVGTFAVGSRPPLEPLSQTVKLNTGVSGNEQSLTSSVAANAATASISQANITTAAGTNISNSTAATPSTGAEDMKSSQVITVVPPTPGDGTPQRPALPKLKIRKDLIS